MGHNEKIQKLHDLALQFDNLEKTGALDLSSEATARSWIEDLLGVFDWNCKDPNEVDQEISLSDAEISNLAEIESTHTRPDYLLCAKSRSLVFIDAKKMGISLKDSKKSAYQIRCYGWSAKHSYAVITNFKEFAIYDCRYKPNKDQDADVARVFYCTFDKYVDEYETIRRHIDKEFVLSGQAFDSYIHGDKALGSKTLDEDFSEKIREWRLRLANSIFASDKSTSIEELSELTQTIIDRIVFCRVAEGLRIIDSEMLLGLTKKANAWTSVSNYIDNECSAKFGGMLFSKGFRTSKIQLSDELIREFIESLYYPNPYRFDVITPALLGNIYERYLGRKLEIKNGKVVDDFKEEYQKTKGAVYTPEYIVHSVCEKTISPLLKTSNLQKVLSLKIIDPSSGSGSFLLGMFDCLQKNLLAKFDSGELKQKESSLFWKNPRTGKTHLRTFAKRELINSCIFGVDIDPQAVEVSRLSLSLKALESASVEPIALRELGLLDSLLIDGIGKNVKLGNSLVDSKIFPFLEELSDDEKEELEIPNGIRQNIDALKKLKVFDWSSKDNFKDVMDAGGFDAVVGNPPYIEIKHYKDNSPLMHKFLSESETYKTCGAGKTDIAIPFIERSLNVLKTTGRLGYIIQTRFFKTDYGASARKMLSDSSALEQIVDFGSLRVFENRTTYTSIVILSKKAVKEVEYTKIDSLSQIDNKLERPDLYSLLRYSTSSRLGDRPWFFVHPELNKLRNSIIERGSLLSSHSDVMGINVGLQILYKKCYLIKGSLTGKKVTGKNLFGDPVQIEYGACRGFVMNRELFPFKELSLNSFVLFPYDIVKGKKKNSEELECKAIGFDEFSQRYPLAGKYLEDKKRIIKEKVETNAGNKWHLFTREQNHCLQSLPKLLIPSTCRDTTAIFDEKGEFYQDNVRVNSITIKDATPEQYKAVCAVINSTAFDCLAKVTCESLDNGYIQFNKQFITQVPLPLNSILSNRVLCQKLASAYEEMASLSNELAESRDAETRLAIVGALRIAEEKLNQVVVGEVYCLSEEENKVLAKFSSRLPLDKYIDLMMNETGEAAEEAEMESA